MNYQASNPESLSETPESLSETKMRSGSSKETSSRSANFLHKLEQLDCFSEGLSWNHGHGRLSESLARARLCFRVLVSEC